MNVENGDGGHNSIEFNYLDEEDKFNITGFIDRLSQRRDGFYEIHDYKTSKSLPDLENLINDRQLSLYQMDIAKRWDDTKKIELVWHYLVFDKELRLSRLKNGIMN
ncbi:MAG: PD-(D/E)XK nuclease family protein [bacterium]|nr:PD-(D/E)XK nuclease family protein [bacterium]